MTGKLLRLIVAPGLVAIIVGTLALAVPGNSTPVAVAALGWDARKHEAMHGQLTQQFRITPSAWSGAKQASSRPPEAARRRTRPIIE
jgi:hypothetical protein